jgi:hypothetical protein
MHVLVLVADVDESRRAHGTTRCNAMFFLGHVMPDGQAEQKGAIAPGRGTLPGGWLHLLIITEGVIP